MALPKLKVHVDRPDWFSNYNIALFTVIFMNIQILPIEGWPISIPKVIFMCLSPFICMVKAPEFSKAAAWSIFFWVVTVAMSVFQFGMVRMSTFYYSAMFLCVFTMYYNLVYEKNCFTLDEFIDIIKFIILAYFYCIVLQEISFLIGLRKNYLLNMMGFPYYELFRLPSLGIEPSSSARTLAVCFYAFLKCNEYKLGYPPSLKYLYYNYKWIIIGFLYTMIIALGSGTAMVCLAILSLYFLKREYAVMVIILGVILYNVIPMLNYEPLTRTIDVLNAAMTGDTDEVFKTDSSAASRVNILLDTFRHLDLSDSATWLGKGVDASFSEQYNIVSGIVDYGLISYLIKLGMFFSCCFTGLFTIEVLMYFLIFGMNIGNIAYGWGCLMIFATIKYFKINQEYYRQLAYYEDLEDYEDEDEIDQENECDESLQNA